MEPPNYRRESTALLFVDPDNVFLSDNGRNWQRLKPIAQELGILDNLKSVGQAARSAGIEVLFVPRRRFCEPGEHESWPLFDPTRGNRQPELALQDIIADEEWAQSSFANTDLDRQLRQQGITHVIVVGLFADACIRSTSRCAMKLGYHVTLVSDATGAFSSEITPITHAPDQPVYAHRTLRTIDLVAALSQQGPPARSNLEGITYTNM
jgi:nicotinamidase-related amidase